MLFTSKNSRPRYTNLHGSSDALALAQYAAQHSPLVVIAANALEAQRLVEEIPFFDPRLREVTAKPWASASPELRVHLLPDWETLPYDHFSPHQDLISERLATLHHIRSHASDVVIVPITTALYPLPPVEHLAAYTFFLKRGEKLNVVATARANDIRRIQPCAAGTHPRRILRARRHHRPVRHGQRAALPHRPVRRRDRDHRHLRRGYAAHPVSRCRRYACCPRASFRWTRKARRRFRQNFRDRFEGDPSKSRIYKDVSKGIAPAGIEYYLPLFFDKTATLFDYLPKNATLCLHHDVDEAIATFGKDAASRYNLLRGDPQHPLLETKELFLDGEQFFIRAKEFARMDILPSTTGGGTEGGGSLVAESAPSLTLPRGEREPKTLTPCATSAIPPIAVDRKAEVPTHAFQNFLQTYAGRTLLLADSLGRREIMSGYLKEYGLLPAVCEDYASFLASNRQVHARRRPHPDRLQPCRMTSSPSSPKPSCMPPSPEAAPRVPRRRATWKACCATCPSSSRAIRWCMSSTASRAIRVW